MGYDPQLGPAQMQGVFDELLVYRVSLNPGFFVIDLSHFVGFVHRIIQMSIEVKNVKRR